ncbi:MAG: DUF853 family protein, partial [Propionibacteriaceae bacterium]|nr:DUF853 family protein [Propionibacteriaceae bacterium]
RAPQASMDPMPADWLANGVASSAMQAKYGQDLNRESAYELLTRRLEDGAARAQAQEEAAAAEREQQEQQRAEQQERPAPRRSTRQPSSRPAPRSGVERVLGSATFWNQVIRVGGQVVRTMWGTAKR